MGISLSVRLKRLLAIVPLVSFDASRFGMLFTFIFGFGSLEPKLLFMIGTRPDSRSLLRVPLVILTALKSGIVELFN